MPDITERPVTALAGSRPRIGLVLTDTQRQLLEAMVPPRWLSARSLAGEVPSGAMTSFQAAQQLRDLREAGLVTSRRRWDTSPNEWMITTRGLDVLNAGQPLQTTSKRPLLPLFSSFPAVPPDRAITLHELRGWLIDIQRTNTNITVWSMLPSGAPHAVVGLYGKITALWTEWDDFLDATDETLVVEVEGATVFISRRYLTRITVHEWGMLRVDSQGAILEFERAFDE